MSIDLPGGRWGNGYPFYRIPLYHLFAARGQKMVLFRGDSHETTIRDRLSKQLAGKSIDLLFIDGDHSYEGVKKDFEMYGGLVRSGGMIAFHDIFPQPQDPTVEVHKFWNEIKSLYEYVEIADPVEDYRYGIGVIVK